MKKIVALLTGRGNNSLKDKNVFPILGKPLLSYPAQECKRVEGISSFFVSSEDEKILAAANELGYQKIYRPSELAKPDSKHVDCIIHALDVMEKDFNVKPDILIVLLANSATIKSSWIQDCIEIIKKDETVSSVIPVQNNNDHHPFRAKRIVNGQLKNFFDIDENISTNRQDLEPNYFACHNFWVLNLSQTFPPFDKGQPPWKFMGNKIIPYVIEYSIDIHDQNDIYLTESWLKSNT